MGSMLRRLQARWGVESLWQVVMILWVFAVTGFSILYVKEPVYRLLGIGRESAWWVKALAFVLVAMPIYQVLLLGYGFLFGQGRFFWAFSKRVMGRFKRLKRLKRLKRVEPQGRGGAGGRRSQGRDEVVLGGGGEGVGAAGDAAREEGEAASGDGEAHGEGHGGGVVGAADGGGEQDSVAASLHR